MKTTTKIAIFTLILVSASLLVQAAYLPSPEKFSLKNGITVYYLKSADLPLISFRMWIKGAGYVFEPAELEGVASLSATLMLKGTAKMDANAVASALDFMGARFNVSAGDEYASISAESLSEHFPRVMEIGADCLMNPSLKEEEFEKERKTRLASLKAVKDNPGAAVRNYFQKAYFGTHPMGHLASGTETSLTKISLPDVKNYYQKYCSEV